MLSARFCNQVLFHHGLSKMTMKERMLPVSKPRAIHLTPSNMLWRMHQTLGDLGSAYHTTVYKNHFSKQQHGFYRKTNRGECSCASAGQQHPQAHPKAVIQLPFPMCKGCKVSGSPKSISEPTTHSSIPEPKTCLECPHCNWMDAKSTHALNTNQHTRMQRHLLVPSSGSKLPVLFHVLLLLFP